MFFKGSRYATVGEHQITDAEGREIHYKKIRFITETRAQVGYVLNQGERLDRLAHRYYQDPERFWRICDANLAMWPPDLAAEIGRMIVIPSSEG